MPTTRTGVMLHTHQLAIDPAVVNRISGDGAAGAPRDTRKARTKPRAAAHFARRPGAIGFFVAETHQDPLRSPPRGDGGERPLGLVLRSSPTTARQELHAVDAHVHCCAAEEPNEVPPSHARPSRL